MRHAHQASRIRFALWFAGILAATFATLAGAEVFRCTVDGKAVYADRPCGGVSTTLRIATAPAAVASDAASDAPVQQSTAPRIAAGMSSLRVLQIEGMPVEKSVEKNSLVPQERWSFCRDNGYTDVYLQNGIVTKVVRRAASIMVGSALLQITTTMQSNAVPAPQPDTFVDSRIFPASVVGARHAHSQ